MADPFAKWPLTLSGLNVDLLETAYCASLRYFAPTGAFAEAVQSGCGVLLPGPGRVVSTPKADMVLAWRSPTETVLLAAAAASLNALAASVAAATDGCLIELTGGLRVVDLSGERIAALLCRLGGSACVPQPGEARRSRLADIPVLALSLQAYEVQLLVERPYLPHLLNWMRETLLDFCAT
jgi:hypothetical protein